MTNWSEWRSFPDPRQNGILIAPFGAGCYEFRRRDSGELILFGMGGHVAQRLTSLLPRPHGCGTRNNEGKRQYILDHLALIEYRTIPCVSADEARAVENGMKERKGLYLFKT